MDGGLELEGCGSAIFIALVVVGIIAAAVLGAGLVRDLQAAAAERDRAEAAVIQAQANLEYTRSTAWQERFMLWTGYLEHETGGVGDMVLAVVVGTIAGVVTAGMVVTWSRRR